jgi:hypothetical protein
MTGTVQIGGAGTVVLDNITATIIDIIGTSTQLPWAAIDSSLGRSFHSVAQGRLSSTPRGRPHRISCPTTGMDRQRTPRMGFNAKARTIFARAFRSSL